jgi:hypothetical protein
MGVSFAVAFHPLAHSPTCPLSPTSFVEIDGRLISMRNLRKPSAKAEVS